MFSKMYSFGNEEKVKILYVRTYDHNCTHRLDFWAPLQTKQKKHTNKKPKCNSTQYPSILHCPENKIQAPRPRLCRVHQALASLSTSLLNTPASPVLSCLQFSSCLRMFSSSKFCLHHALCLECPSLHLHLTKTFLSFGEAATASQNLAS